MRSTVAERFWSKVDLFTPSGCWLWTAATGRDGYGRFRALGRNVLAHRFAYESLVGPIPDGLQIDHLCRVRACANPSHLEPVTQRENLLRGAGGTNHYADKTECPQGHPYDEANTYNTPSGKRACRSCTRDNQRRRRAALKELV